MLARSRKHQSQRGQVLPVWALGSLACLSMAFFLINYANIVRWQVRAQNAADSASGASLSLIANYYNTMTMAVYAADLAEVRLRYLDQALVNNIQGNGCSPVLQCDVDYDLLLPAFYNAQSAYVDAAGLVIVLAGGMDNVNQFDAAGAGAWEAIIPGYTQGTAYLDCGDGDDDYKVCTASTDSAFSYFPLDIPGIPNLNGTTGSDVGIGEPNTVDAASCADVPFVATGFLGLPVKTFRAVGRSALGLIPSTESVTVSSLVPSSGASPYQPNEDWVTYNGGSDVGSYYTVDYSTLAFTLTFFTPGDIAPYTSFHPNSFSTPGAITSAAPCPTTTVGPTPAPTPTPKPVKGK